MPSQSTTSYCLFYSQPARGTNKNTGSDRDRLRAAGIEERAHHSPREADRHHSFDRSGIRACLGFLKNVVKPPFRNLQNFVLNHPLFALLLDLIADHIHRLGDLKDWLNRSDQKAAFDAEIAAVQNEGLRNLFQETVASFVHLQLPEGRPERKGDPGRLRSARWQTRP